MDDFRILFLHLSLISTFTGPGHTCCRTMPQAGKDDCGVYRQGERRAFSRRLAESLFL